MRVVVHVEPYELTELIHVLEAADFRVAVVPIEIGDGSSDRHAEVELVTGREWLTTFEDRVVVDDLVIDLEARVVHSGGLQIELTSREFDLLAVLVRHANQVLSKNQLVDLLWTEDPVTPNAVEARISSLRRKLGRSADPLITTVRGVGYVFRSTSFSPDERRGQLARQREALVEERRDRDESA